MDACDEILARVRDIELARAATSPRAGRGLASGARAAVAAE
jgi:hypothetical protein